MRNFTLLLTSLLLTIPLLLAAFNNESARAESDFALNQSDAEEHILVFSKTAGYRHDSIETGQEALRQLADQFDVGITVSEDAELFNTDRLSHFDAVVFLNTTGTLFNADQKEAFKTYIQNGGGFAGVHSAADTEYEWPWYGEFLGAWFDNHPPGIINADILVEDPDHPATAMLPQVWNRDDEWYNYQGFGDHINVLHRLNTDSFEGSDHPGNHPIAWYHEYDGGRVFYTGLGHTKESYSEDLFLVHLWAGIQYAMGK